MSGSDPFSKLDFMNQTATFIVHFGFLAVGISLIVVFAPLIWHLTKAQYPTHVALWAGLMFLIAYGAMQVADQFGPKRVLLGGAILKVPNGYAADVSTNVRSAGKAYIKRENDVESTKLSSFFYISISRGAPTCMAVSISSSGENSEDMHAFRLLPLTSQDLDPRVQVMLSVHKTGADMELWVTRERDSVQQGSRVKLSPLGDGERDCEALPEVVEEVTVLGTMFGQAFAQEVDVKSWADLLQSDDVFLRRNARIDLSLQGEAALATIGELVQADNYREQLGGVVALSIMPEAERCKARENPGLIAAIAGLAKSEDPTLSESATRALIVPKDCD